MTVTAASRLARVRHALRAWIARTQLGPAPNYVPR
jgi:hypothetical protein